MANVFGTGAVDGYETNFLLAQFEDLLASFTIYKQESKGDARKLAIAFTQLEQSYAMFKYATEPKKLLMQVPGGGGQINILH